MLNPLSEQYSITYLFFFAPEPISTILLDWTKWSNTLKLLLLQDIIALSITNLKFLHSLYSSAFCNSRASQYSLPLSSICFIPSNIFSVYFFIYFIFSHFHHLHVLILKLFFIIFICISPFISVLYIFDLDNISNTSSFG